MDANVIVGWGGFGLGIYNAIRAHLKEKRELARDRDSGIGTRIARAEADLRASFQANIGHGTRVDSVVQALREGVPEERVRTITYDLMLAYNGNPDGCRDIIAQTITAAKLRLQPAP